MNYLKLFILIKRTLLDLNSNTKINSLFIQFGRWYITFQINLDCNTKHVRNYEQYIFNDNY